MVVLWFVGLVVGLPVGVLLLVALALSVRAARAGRQLLGDDGLPLVGARHAQFGDATAALAQASREAERTRSPQEGRPLRLVRTSCDVTDQPHPVRAA